MGSITMGGRRVPPPQESRNNLTFQKARTVRRLARRRGWQVPAGEPCRDPETGSFPLIMTFSLDKAPQ